MIQKTKESRSIRNEYLLIMSLFIIPFVLPFVNAEAIQDILHLNIQAKNSTGGVVTGTFNFTFNISKDNSCTDIIYNDNSELTTDSEGIVSHYLENVGVINFTEQLWMCEYRNGSLEFNERIAMSPYSFNIKRSIINGTILSIDNITDFSTTHLPNNITTISGTYVIGNVTSIQYTEDDDVYNVTEDAGANPLTININFTDVTSFDNLVGRVYYRGGQGHQVQLEIQRSDTGNWENYLDLTDMTNYNNIYTPVFDPEKHVTATKNVSVRFAHFQNGVPSHSFSIDYIALIDGFTTTTVSDHDGLGGRDIKENHPWALPIDGSRVMSALNVTGNVNLIGAVYINETLVNIWLYNQTYTDGTYNATYDKWAYNETYTDGTYNATYDTHYGPNANVSLMNASISGNVTVGGEMQGSRLSFAGGEALAKTATFGIKIGTQGIKTGGGGISMPRDGSIVGISARALIAATMGQDGDLDWTTYINGVAKLTATDAVPQQGAAYRVKSNTAARGTYTFAADDYIQVEAVFTSFTGTVDNTVVFVEVQFDT